jgi:hypothetical protein
MTTKATKSRQGPRCTELAGKPAGVPAGVPVDVAGDEADEPDEPPDEIGASLPAPGRLSDGCGVVGSKGGRFEAGLSD